MCIITVAVQNMSRFRRCRLDNIIFILVVFSLTTLAVCTQQDSSSQGHIKVREVTDEGHVPANDEDIDTAAMRAVTKRWMNNKLDRVRRSAAPSAAGTDTTSRAKWINANTEKRSSGNLSWSAHRPVSATANDKYVNEWLDAALRRLSNDLHRSQLTPRSATFSNDLHHSQLTHQTAPFLKRNEDSRQRSISAEEEEGEGGDWDANGWAGNNLRTVEVCMYSNECWAGNNIRIWG